MAGQGLPSDLDFTLKKAAPRGIRQFRTALAPIGGVPSSGITDFLRYDIETGRKGQYLDTTNSYLQFKVQAGTGDITLDGSAYSFFQRLTILSGGAVLEDIPEYANMCQLYLDNQMPEDKRRSDSNVLLGMSSQSPTDITFTTGTVSVAGLTGTAITSGTTATVVTNVSAVNQNIIQRRGTTIAAGTSYTFCVPLVSGILGPNGSTKYLPIGSIMNDLRCEIQLANAQNAVINTNAGATGWSLTEANFMLSIIELDSQVQNMIDSATGGNYYISSETFKWYSNTISNGSQSSSVLIPARFSSVKGLIGSFRPVASQNNYLRSAVSSRTNPFYHVSNACSLQFTIGSQLYPNSPIRSAQELYAEVEKYFHALGNLSTSSAINQTNFLVTAEPPAVSTGGNAASVAAYFNGLGSGCFALNLDNVANRSDVMSSGINTLTSNIIMNASYPTPPSADQILSVYAHLDMVIVIENGILSVRV